MQQQLDTEALTTLPLIQVYCKQGGITTYLRANSWSYQPALCSKGERPCPSCSPCSRVATAHNRPLVSLKVAA